MKKVQHGFMGNVKGSNPVTESPVTLIIDIVPLAKGEMREWQTRRGWGGSKKTSRAFAHKDSERLEYAKAWQSPAAVVASGSPLAPRPSIFPRCSIKKKKLLLFHDAWLAWRTPSTSTSFTPAIGFQYPDG